MALMKTQNVVINTSYVVAIKLDNQTSWGEQRIFAFKATPKISLFQWDIFVKNLYHFAQFQLISPLTNSLPDNFTSFHNKLLAEVGKKSEYSFNQL